MRRKRILNRVNQEDRQTWQLGGNPEFLVIMQRLWQRLDTEGGVSLAEAQHYLLVDQPQAPKQES